MIRSKGGQAVADVGKLFNRALTLHNQGRAAEAEALYRDLIAVDPAHVGALNHLGVLCAQAGRVEESEALIRRALDHDPDDAGAWDNLGTVLSRTGRPEDALAAYGRALTLDPDRALTLNNLGAALKSLNRLGEAADRFRQSLALTPRAETWSNYANVLHAGGHHGESEKAHREAIAADPGYAVAYNNLGGLLKSRGRYGEALSALAKAVSLAPDYADALNNLGETFKERGQGADAVTCYERALEVAPDRADIHSNLLLALNAVPGLYPKDVFSRHRDWGRRFADPLTSAAPRHGNDPERPRRLRIGYVSADFRRHSCAFFMEPVLEHHDRRNFGITCYGTGGARDAVTERFEGLAGRWRDISTLSDQQAAKAVREDGIHILVDLSGHTMNNRLGLFARKPAPVQVTWLGYPNTTGLKAMDARLTDAVADPGEGFHSETLVRLENGFLCYRPPADAPDIETRAQAGPVTFGSCNNLAKLTPLVVETWAEIMRRSPGSRLLLKAKALGDGDSARRVEGLFTGFGIAQERLDFMGWIEDGDHLSIYNSIDVALDPFPYNGTTTTCEALWMGTPVVTLRGESHAGRVGASLLSKVGLEDMIAKDREAYVDCALAGPGNVEGGEDLRKSMGASPLTDGKAFTGCLEDAFRTLWRDKGEGDHG